MRKLPALITLPVVAVLALSACTNASEEGSSGANPSGGASGTTSGFVIPEPFDVSGIAKDEAIAGVLPAEIATAGTLVVGTNPQYAPAEFLDTDGQTPIGYDIDIINAVGAVLGLDIEIQAAEFASIIPALGSKYDAGISSFTITAEREAQTNMVSYFNAGEAFAVAKGNPLGIDPDDICGRTVAVQTGTVEDSGADTISAQCTTDGKKALQILRFASQSDATNNLIGGKADLMYADGPIVAFAVAQTGGQVEQLGEQFNSAPQGIVTAKADVQLAEAIQKAVQKLMDDGTMTDILTPWGNETLALTTAELNPAAE